MQPRPSTALYAEHTAAGDFKHYQIQGCLGEGGFGQVFEAWDSKLRRKVALKRLKHTGSPAGRGLLDEARLAASLRHAAYVKIYSIEEDEQSQSIVMELVDGETLKQLLAGGPLAHGAAVDIVRQIAEAMQEAHQRGLVHGDLKPSNLMLERSGAVRILDFGLAAQVHADATTSNIEAEPQGTIAYMAPELLTGARTSELTDIYALGVVLFELLAGHRPFPELSGLPLAAALLQSSSQHWPFPAGLDPALVRMIQDMTARQPDQRVPGMQAVCARLAADCGAALSAPAPAPVPTPSGQSAPRPAWWRSAPRRAVMPALAGGAVVVVALAAINLWPAPPPAPAAPPPLEVPYSTAQEMAAGLTALRLYDRPGKLDEAARHFNRVLEHERDHAGAIAGMALVYARRDQSDNQDDVWLMKATAGAQQAIRLNEQLGLAHAALGIALERAGKSEEALERLSHALRLEPTNVFALLGRVSALLTLRRYDDALDQAAHGQALYPDERSFADLAGRIHFEQGNYPEAERAFRHSLLLQPDAVFAYANLNAVLQRRGRIEEALQVLQRGLQVRPNAWLYTNLGNALFVQGDYAGAAAAFENAVSPDKGNPNNYLGWANLADALQWIPGRDAQAREAYRRAHDLLQPRLDRAPHNVTLSSRMALYLARSGESARARDLIERALAQAPGALDVQFRAALVFELTGSRERAIEALIKARTLGYPTKTIEAEPDLVALRRDPRYRPPSP
jgi:serine/threonine-protein kinase